MHTIHFRWLSNPPPAGCQILAAGSISVDADRYASMVRPSGFRPRDRCQRLALAAAILGKAPFPADDDGWSAACQTLLVPNPMPQSAPEVTIVICTYNRASLLPDAVRSARDQDWPCTILVVNDGSTDQTAQWLGTQADLRVLSHQPNRGKPAALNTAINAVETEFFLVLDDDDRLLPGSVRTLANALLQRPEAGAAWGDTIVFDDATGQAIDYRAASRLPNTKQAVLTTIPALPGATLIRTAAQSQLAAFDSRLVRGQDMDHFLRLSSLFPVVTVPLPVLLYRKHDGLRGSAAARWKKHADPQEHRRRFLACVQPVFRERWALAKPARSDAFAWALGLHQRELKAEAQRELNRWSAPFSAFEESVKKRVGHVLSAHPGGRERSVSRPPGAVPMHAPAEADRARLLVVDDGDDGALEACLLAAGEHEAVEVVVDAARDTIGGAQLFWPGHYRAAGVFAASGLVRLRLSSTPDWESPPVDAALIPPLPPASAVRALAWALGWALPSPTRQVTGSTLHPAAAACRAARGAKGAAALAPAIAVMTTLPNWAPGLWLGAQACAQAGLAEDAEKLRFSAGAAAGAAGG